MQFLSEPSGGSDVAGALTTAVRDGDEWVVNGSKIWTTGAWFSDYGLCLAAHQLGRAQAPRPQRVHRQDPPARHRAAPHRDDQRLARVLPGVHHRRPGARLRPRRRGRPGLDRRHPLDVPREERHGRRLARTSPATCTPTGVVERGHATRWSSWPGPPAAWTIRGRGPDRRGRHAATRRGRRCPQRITAGMRTGVFPDNSAAIARLMTRGRAAAQRHHRARARRVQRRRHAARRPVGRAGVQLPRAPDVGHRRRHHRDGPQQHQRAGPRHAPGDHDHDKNIPFRDVPKGPSSGTERPRGGAGDPAPPFVLGSAVVGADEVVVVTPVPRTARVLAEWRGSPTSLPMSACPVAERELAVLDGHEVRCSSLAGDLAVVSRR